MIVARSFVTAICILALGACHPKSVQSKRQEPQVAQSTIDLLYKSDGKIVTVEARLSKFAEQHLSHPLFEELEKKMTETYVDLKDGGQQIVLVSERPIECAGLLRITGKVYVISAGGPENTKQSYSRPWLRVIDFKCE